MRVNVYENVGSYSKNVDIEYDSSVKTDREETDKFVSRILKPEIMMPEDENVPEKAE